MPFPQVRATDFWREWPRVRYAFSRSPATVAEDDLFLLRGCALALHGPESLQPPCWFATAHMFIVGTVQPLRILPEIYSYSRSLKPPIRALSSPSCPGSICSTRRYQRPKATSCWTLVALHTDSPYNEHTFLPTVSNHQWLFYGTSQRTLPQAKSRIPVS